MNDLMTKSFVSYVDLKRQSQIDIKSEEVDIEKGNESYLSTFFQEADTIKSNLEEISSLVFDLQTLNNETKSIHSAKILRGLRDRMESNMVSILRKSNMVRSRLECLEKSNLFKEKSAMERSRVFVTNGLRTKLKEMMKDFQSLRDKIVLDHYGCPKDGDEEVVMDIKRSLNKLQEVFLEMAVLVDEQGQNLNDIEGNMAKARSFVSGGTNSLVYAKQMKDKHSKNWVCLVWALVMIICVVCLIAMWSSF